ncbi:unnamed protein product [Larinioides sclopetarius]|uniref:Uncharacterized protein n=1 Tax=Larinioides sclopetarius TaxID=280406 RepID=A0AAV1ZGI3_9ARAC
MTKLSSAYFQVIPTLMKMLKYFFMILTILGLLSLTLSAPAPVPDPDGATACEPSIKCAFLKFDDPPGQP